MSPLFQELQLPCGARIKNRICKSAMTEGLADLDGNVTPGLITLYRRWAEGGAGLLVTGNVMVDGRYLERSGNLVIDGREDVKGLEALAKAGTSHGCQFWVQLNHPGRQCSKVCTFSPVAPSAVQLNKGFLFAHPRELSDAEILGIIERFAYAAKRVKDAGFTGVQLHSAHGYLGSQFLSPLTNLRTDRWGGSLENRARFLLELIRAVRKNCGKDFPIAVKINSSDFQQGAFSMEESLQVAQWVAQEGIDLLEVSGGTYEVAEFLAVAKESTRRREAFFLDYAHALKGLFDIPLMITGGFRSVHGMEHALDVDDCQMIGIARPFCSDPAFPLKMQAGTLDLLPSMETEIQNRIADLLPVGQASIFANLLQAGWFCKQMIRLSQGLEPELKLKVMRDATSYLVRDIALGFRWRLARVAAGKGQY